MKTFFLSIVAFIFLFAVCSAQPGRYLSTSEALNQFREELKNQELFVFPEWREKPITWFDSIPLEKIGDNEVFQITAQPGEFYVFQLGVWALRKEALDVQIEFSDLKAKNGKTISSTKMTCFNSGGIDFMGDTFSKKINIPSGRVQALWLGIDMESAEEGTYAGSVSVTSGEEKQTILLSLNVSGETVPNHGYNEGSRLSRLNWLNSTAGIDDEITKGYIPIRIEDKNIHIQGRELQIVKNGLPGSITSYFDSSNQSLLETGQNITEQPFQFVIETEDKKMVRLTPGKLVFTEQTPSKVVWKVLNTSEEYSLEVTGQMEFDGFVDYRLKLMPKVPLKVKDIRLEIPVVKEKAEYMMGLGHEGGFRTPDWKWKWDASKNQDMLWVGAVNGGLRIKWKAENYVRPLVNIYYEFGQLNMPPSWYNAGRGGVDVGQQNNNVVISAYSGQRELKPGEELNFDFELLITPLKVIDRNIKLGDRYYHGGGSNTSVKIENAKKVGSNIINIHHAEDIYPFINYPYLDANVPELKQLVADAHSGNMRMKFYYTTRELTKNLPEFWAFYSLNGEVIFPGPGNASRTEALHPNGPNEWLIKNMREKYIPAWYNLVNEGKFKGETDLSVITTPDSRLNNFYVAGLDWMVQNIGIDGVYIDDSALDRFTLRRARKIIDRFRPDGRMDLHSWNHFNQWAGYTNCLNLYMDLLPYFDLVWIGEGRDYNRMPDHWLVEVSGIPLGLTGQMLEGGGNPWRGMVYGITTRAGWTKNSPEYLWKFFDEYHFPELQMMGYWEKDCPVTSSNELVKATVYKNRDTIIIAVANWSDNDVTTSLGLDKTKLGISSGYEIKIPEIREFQEEQATVALNRLTIPGGKGYLMVIKNKDE